MIGGADTDGCGTGGDTYCTSGDDSAVEEVVEWVGGWVNIGGEIFGCDSWFPGVWCIIELNASASAFSRAAFSFAAMFLTLARLREKAYQHCVNEAKQKLEDSAEQREGTRESTVQNANQSP
jgi:hypothetical protein